ncbi:hypothetical protein VTI74DRAFT_8296 [Chaetomium olivicolor]
MGRPILQIPESRETELIMVSFSPLERSRATATGDKTQTVPNEGRPGFSPSSGFSPPTQRWLSRTTSLSRCPSLTSR